MKVIKAGVIGTGFIGRAHIENLRRLENIHVEAIAGSNQEKTNEAAEALGVGKAYGSWEQLLLDPSIDAVHICTPNHLHYPIAKRALELGKHVICEKPLSMNVEEAIELAQIADRQSLIHAVHFNLRYYPLVQEARQYIRRNKLGELLSFQGQYLQDWLLYEDDYNWRMDPSIGGNSRALADIGSHLFDMAEHVVGRRIRAVCAQVSIMHPVRKRHVGGTETYSHNRDGEYEEIRITTEDYASILLEFDNGAKGTAVISQVAAGRKNRLGMELNGTKSSLAWDSESPNQLWIGHRDKPNEVLFKDPALMDNDARGFASYPGGHAEGFPDTSKQLFRQVYKAISNGQPDGVPAYPTFYDGLREMVLCAAILESAEKKQWIEL